MFTYDVTFRNLIFFIKNKLINNFFFNLKFIILYYKNSKILHVYKVHNITRELPIIYTFPVRVQYFPSHRKIFKSIFVNITEFSSSFR